MRISDYLAAGLLLIMLLVSRSFRKDLEEAYQAYE